MAIRGIRGATTVDANTAEAILEATREMLQLLQRANGFAPEELAAVWFTATDDINAAFPARAARQLGWVDVPLMDAQEMRVAGSLAACIRVLILWNTDLDQASINHMYLRRAVILRPDLARAVDKEQSR